MREKFDNLAISSISDENWNRISRSLDLIFLDNSIFFG